MDRLESMQTLLAAVEAGSLSAASRKLGVPLATVSRKVSQLEQHLGTRLLSRSSRRLSLTDAGRSYAAACQRILAELAEAEREASGEHTGAKGQLTLTAPVVFGRFHVLPVVVDFLAAYPEVDVRLQLADGLANLFEERVDAALRIGELTDASLLAVRLGTVRRVVCASPAYFERAGVPKTPEELCEHACVSFTALSAPSGWAFRAPSGRRGRSVVPVRPRLVVTCAEAAIDAAVAGAGLTCVLSYQVREALRRGQLRLCLEDHEPEPLPVHLVHAAPPPLPRKLRAFLDFAAPRLRAELAQAVPPPPAGRARRRAP